MSKLQTVMISQIRENPVALRTVNRESEKYLGLVASMQQKGFLGAITARERQDKETEEVFFELVDGLHRYSAAKDAGLEKINIDIVDLNDDEVLEAQILQNIHTIETRPIEYTQQLKRVLARNPFMTEADLATKLGKSATWISSRLGLAKIDNEEIKKLINEGKINLSNAYTLAKLPADEMANFIESAMTDPPDTFIPAVTARIKEVRDARRKGQDASSVKFAPMAHMRKMKDLKLEHENAEIGPELIKILKIKKPLDAFALAIAWMLHLDAESIKIQESEYDARIEKKEEMKKKKAAERAKTKAEKLKKQSEEAAKAEANAQAEADGKPLPYPELVKKEEDKKPESTEAASAE